MKKRKEHGNQSVDGTNPEGGAGCALGGDDDSELELSATPMADKWHSQGWLPARKQVMLVGGHGDGHVVGV